MRAIKECLSFLTSRILCAVILVFILAIFFAASNNWRKTKIKVDDLSKDLTALQELKNASKNKVIVLQKEVQNASSHFERIDLHHKSLIATFRSIPTYRGIKKYRAWKAMKQHELTWMQVHEAYRKAKAVAGEGTKELDKITEDLMSKQKTLESYSSSFVGYCILFVERDGLKWFVWGLFILLATPFLWKVFLYYVVARYVATFPPATIKGIGDRKDSPCFHGADVAVNFPLKGKTLYLRSGDWGKKRTNVVVKTKLLWSWRYPLISFAASLCELVVLREQEGRDGDVTITSPYSDIYIAHIDLNNSNGIVIRPKFLIGITEGVKVRTKWNFGLHNILSMRMRQIILRGNGSVFLAGSWGVDVIIPQEGADNRVEDNLLLAYEPTALYSLVPTETFWHYWRHKSSLFDQRLMNGVFFTQNNTASSLTNNKESLFERILGVFFNGIGKFFGF